MNGTNNEDTVFDINRIGEYISNAATRKTFSQGSYKFEFIQAHIVRGFPTLTLREINRRKNGLPGRTLIYAQTNREKTRWAIVSNKISECGPVDCFELVDLLENILAWQEFMGLPRVGVGVAQGGAFNIEETIVAFSRFANLNPLQSSELVSMILAKDYSTMHAFWRHQHDQRQRAIDAYVAETQSNVETEEAARAG